MMGDRWVSRKAKCQNYFPVDFVDFLLEGVLVAIFFRCAGERLRRCVFDAAAVAEALSFFAGGRPCLFG
jgi:hypothetical protein